MKKAKTLTVILLVTFIFHCFTGCITYNDTEKTFWNSITDIIEKNLSDNTQIQANYAQFIEQAELDYYLCSSKTNISLNEEKENVNYINKILIQNIYRDLYSNYDYFKNIKIHIKYITFHNSQKENLVSWTISTYFPKEDVYNDDFWNYYNSVTIYLSDSNTALSIISDFKDLYEIGIINFIPDDLSAFPIPQRENLKIFTLPDEWYKNFPKLNKVSTYIFNNDDIQSLKGIENLQYLTLFIEGNFDLSLLNDIDDLKQVSLFCQNEENYSKLNFKSLDKLKCILKLYSSKINDEEINWITSHLAECYINDVHYDNKNR